jgi:hypothetical protein
MPKTVRVMLECGKKKVVAVAYDWPGWERGARSEEESLQVLERHRARYQKVAALAGLAKQFKAAGAFNVVERLGGASTTDFFGVSGRPASDEHGPMTNADCDRKVALLEASWAYFDQVGSHVSETMRKGPRGGGRDRDRIIQHTLWAETDFARKVGLRTDPETLRTAKGVRAHRNAYAEAIREHNARGAEAKSWTLQFLIRRSAFHMLDHAWEMEDKDLSSE